MRRWPAVITSRIDWIVGIFLAFFFLLSVAAVFLVTLPLFIKFILLLALFYYAYYLFRRYVFFKHPRSIQKLIFISGVCFECFLQDGSRYLLELMQDSIVMRRFLFLCLRSYDSKYQFFLLRFFMMFN